MYVMNSIKSSIKSHPLWVALYPSDGLFYWGSELYLSNSRRGRRREEGGLLRLGTMELYLSNCSISPLTTVSSSCLEARKLYLATRRKPNKSHFGIPRIR